MENITTIGLDIAQQVFQVQGVNGAGAVVGRRKLRRDDVAGFFKALPPCLIGIEACATGHHWARVLMALGHEVRLMPASYVKPYVKRQKNDATDAEAICEAVARPTMRFVPVKSEEQQSVLMLHRVRELLIRQRTMLVNALRGHLAEFGIVTRQGIAGVGMVVKDYVRIARARGRETFVPLSHPPGHAQVDFGQAIGVIGGVRCKIHFFCMDLPQSDACFVKAYPAETTEAFLDGHVSAFAFFGGVPLSVLYDNLKIAVAKICGDGRRERTRAFTELVSHYLFRDRFGAARQGERQRQSRGAGEVCPLELMTPIPVAASFDDLNDMLVERCRGPATYEE